MATRRSTGKQPLFGGTEQGIVMGWVGGAVLAGVAFYFLTRPKKKKSSSTATGGGALPPPTP